MKAQPFKTPVIATCKKTGTEYRFDSITSTGVDGFLPDKVRDCLKGRAKTHAGMTWRAAGPQRDGWGNKRPHQVAELLNAGKSRSEASEALGLAPATIRVYVSQARILGLLSEGVE